MGSTMRSRERKHQADPTRPVGSAPAGPLIRIDGLAKSFIKDDRRIYAIRELCLTVAAGTFVVVLGRSGCGKSTLLNLIAGLSRPDEGVITYAGAPVAGPCTELGYLTQHDTLMPWRDLRRNIELPLELRGEAASVRRQIAAELIERVRLRGFEKHYPRELSGGMRRRAGLARTLCTDPDTLLMDEPFGALDAQLRQELQEDLLRLWHGTGKTVLFVTHDLDEALCLGDRIVVLGRGGRVVLDEPVDLDRPRDLDTVRLEPAFVASHQRIAAALKE